MEMKVKRTERGWAGHFCGAASCLFRRNTLLEYNDTKLVVSTVGNMVMRSDEPPYSFRNLAEVYKASAPHGEDHPNGDLLKDGHFYGKHEIGVNRHAETMVFHAKLVQNKYWDIAVDRNYPFESKWAAQDVDDNEINDMHERVVEELIAKLSGVPVKPAPVPAPKVSARRLRAKK